MSTKLYELNDRIITDTGEVIAKYELLIKKALSGEVFSDLLTVHHPDVERYNIRCPDNFISIWDDNGEDSFNGPDKATYDWTIPKKYLSLDVVEVASIGLIEKGLDKNSEYFDRLVLELKQMEDRGMFPFVRCLIYVIDQFKQNNVIWGIGRGSSCASLVLYVLGINRVDPIKYKIPPEEFFK